MSKPTFVYCFSKEIALDYQRYLLALTWLKESIELITKYHNAKILTDRETVADVQNLGVPVEIVDHKELIFVDDFKVQCVQLLGRDEILIDPDVFVYKELKFSTDYDMLYESNEDYNSPYYRDVLMKFNNVSSDIELKKLEIPKVIPNIGLLQINNSELLAEYVQGYNTLRKLILDKYPKKDDYMKFGVILSQYTLGLLLDKKYNIFSFRKENNFKTYVHHAGENKYRQGLKKIETII